MNATFGGEAICPTALGRRPLPGIDPKVLIYDGSLTGLEPVMVDLEFGLNPEAPVNYFDANSNGSYDCGEDIVLDDNRAGISS